MPPRPLVESPRRQRQLVAVLMGLVFLGSIGVAYLFSEARFARRQVNLQVVQVDRMALRVPADWQRDAAEEAVMAEALDMERAGVFRDPDRPHRVLRVMRFALPQAVPPRAMLESLLPALLSEADYQAFQPQDMHTSGSEEALQVADVIGISPLGPAPEQARLHLVAAMTLDGRTHWVMHLVDRPDASEPPPHLLYEDTMLFRQIQRSAVLSLPAAEGEGNEGRADERGEADEASEAGDQPS